MELWLLGALLVGWIISSSDFGEAGF